MSEPRMKGRESMLTAMMDGLSDGFPVVIPYTGIFLRDHWDEVTEQPWWATYSWDIPSLLKAEVALQEKLGIDWVTCGTCPPRAWRETHRVEPYGDRVYLVNTLNGGLEQVRKPPVGGVKIDIDTPTVESVEDVDREIRLIGYGDLIQTGRLDYAKAVAARFGSEKFIVAEVSSPLWEAYHYLGFRGMMVNLFKRQGLVEHLLEKLTARTLELLRAYAKVGVDGVWIEECLCSADIMSPASFDGFALPYTRELIAEIKWLKMKSIYYACGDVRDRLERMVEAGPDCIALEESKKGFRIDIAWVNKVVAGRACLFGNLDAVSVLQNGTHAELERAIKRQLEVGCQSGKFVMSLGSPVTPATPVERVREYVTLVRSFQPNRQESNKR